MTPTQSQTQTLFSLNASEEHHLDTKCQHLLRDMTPHTATNQTATQTHTHTHFFLFFWYNQYCFVNLYLNVLLEKGSNSAPKCSLPSVAFQSIKHTPLSPKPEAKMNWDHTNLALIFSSTKSWAHTITATNKSVRTRSPFLVIYHWRGRGWLSLTQKAWWVLINTRHQIQVGSPRKINSPHFN